MKDYTTDIYQKSIYEIVMENKVDTEEKFSNLLDNVGYYGRNKIVQIQNRPFQSRLFKVEIYLPNSILYYQWPANGGYSFLTREIHYFKRRRVLPMNFEPYFLRYLGAEQFFNLSDVPSNKIFELSIKADVRYKKTERIFKWLYNNKFYRNGKCLLKPYDGREIFGNLATNLYGY